MMGRGLNYGKLTDLANNYNSFILKSPQKISLENQ